MGDALNFVTVTQFITRARSKFYTRHIRLHIRSNPLADIAASGV